MPSPSSQNLRSSKSVVTGISYQTLCESFSSPVRMLPKPDVYLDGSDGSDGNNFIIAFSSQANLGP
jgi:hypothetical protein